MDTDTPQSTATRRPRFQFRLRTLLVVVTLAAVACGYLLHEYRIVRERHSLSNSNAYMTMEPQHGGRSAGRHSIPLVRWWLGDMEFIAFGFAESAPEETLGRFRTAFPEARIFRYSEAGDK